MPIALVEQVGQLEAVPDDYRVAAATPSVLLAAEQQGREVERVGGFVTDDEIEELGLETFARLDALCTRLDALVAAGDATQPARWHSWTLKVLLDAVCVRALELERLREHAGHEQILWFPSALPYTTVAAVILPVDDAREWPASELPQSQPAHTPSVVAWARDQMRGLAERGPSAVRRARMRVLALDAQYSVPAVAAALGRRRCAVDYWHGQPRTYRHGSLRLRRHKLPEAVDRGTYASAWRTIEADDEVRSLFASPRGRDLFDAAAPRLRSLVEQKFPAAVDHYRAARKVMADLEPDAVLLSLATYADARAGVEAANEAGIPTVVSRHGELGARHLETLALEDVAVVDWAACWGEWEERWTRKYGHAGIRTRVTGSPLVERDVGLALSRAQARAQSGIGDGDVLVMYVPTAMAGASWYASHRQPRDVEYFELQRELVAGISAIDGVRCAVKLHPNDSERALRDWIESGAAGDVAVVDSPGLGRLVNLADAVVLDFPSTTLVQALFGSARIYVVDHPILRWEPGVRAHFERHGIPFEMTKPMVERIRADAARGTLAGPVSYPAEARRPMAADGSDSAADRVADLVIDVAEGRAQ